MLHERHYEELWRKEKTDADRLRARVEKLETALEYYAGGIENGNIARMVLGKEGS